MTTIEKLTTETPTIKELISKLNEVIDAHNDSLSRSGPKSLRQMTDEDAKRIMLGDLALESHTKAAETLGLSYGQIYSARKGFTFKSIYKDWERLQTKTVKARA